MLRCENPPFSMAKAKALRSRATALSGWRLVVIYAAMVAFAFQSYVIQTHIHFAPSGRLSPTPMGQTAITTNTPPMTIRPIARSVRKSSTAASSSPRRRSSLLPPSLAVSTIAVVDQALPHILAPSHSWRGRAPPHA